MNPSTATERRDWDFAKDGDLEVLYVETRRVTIANGPSAGHTKPVLEFHVGIDDELVTYWPSAVARRKLSEELNLRGKPDFEPGERIRISRPEEKTLGKNGLYWADEVEFEFAAPKPTAADLLGGSLDQVEDRPRFDSDDSDIPFE
jgi:hypothetical protein